MVMKMNELQLNVPKKLNLGSTRKKGDNIIYNLY